MDGDQRLSLHGSPSLGRSECSWTPSWLPHVRVWLRESQHTHTQKKIARTILYIPPEIVGHKKEKEKQPAVVFGDARTIFELAADFQPRH